MSRKPAATHRARTAPKKTVLRCLEKIRWSYCSRHLITGCLQHCAIRHLDQRRTVKTVKRGAQAGAIGAKLADLDPVAFHHIIWQQEWPMHDVERITAWSKETERRICLAG